MRLMSAGWLGWLAGLMVAAQAAEITNVADLLLTGRSGVATSARVRLQGAVWWANPAARRLVLSDDTGAAEIEVQPDGAFPTAGRAVVLEGEGTVSLIGGAARLGVVGPLIANDGVHVMAEKRGTAFLRAGKNPVRLEWFNGLDKFGLALEWEGPGLPRTAIAPTALFRRDPVSGEFVPGLDYQCVEALGEVLPEFDRLPALKSGVVSGFTLAMLPRAERIGVRFSGWLEVPQTGLYTFYLKSDDGSRWFVGPPTFRITPIGPASFPAPRPLVPGQTLTEREDGLWAQAEGTVNFASENALGVELELLAGSGKMQVRAPANSGLRSDSLLNRRVRARGVCKRVAAPNGEMLAGVLLVPSAEQVELLDVPASPGQNAGGALSVLTTAAAVHQLSREEAQRGYPAHLRGVVTCLLPERSAFTLQDATRGLYVVDFSRAALPEIGELVEVEGVSDPGLFAPIVNASVVRSLGAGRLPDPVQPTWDQLLNGSLDAQFVQLQGIVTAVHSNSLTLLTRHGRIKMELRLNGPPGQSLERYEDSLVSIRGTLFASWDYVTHQVRVGEIRIYGAAVSVESPAPGDLFALPAQSVAQLQLFNPQADVVRRVKVCGQILHIRGTEHYLSDGANGLRFIAKKSPALRPGDQVEVVGFPEWSGVSPLLREAVVRQTGHAPLPSPRDLPPDRLLQGSYDALRVRVRGVLANVRETAGEQVFEIQTGVRSFAARLSGARLAAPPLGSTLELTGTYSGLGGDKAMGQDISSFELLLASPADLRVLARPPWWTLKRLAVMVGALVFGLALTGLWITQLHRKVEQRTAELEVQIRERQRVEQQRLMEQERARVAQDLHDELGSGLTEIGMLAARARAAAASEERWKNYLEQMSDKARAMVTALDEIVWAMNPRHDSLGSLVSYFCLYAERFLGLANIAWRLEDTGALPETQMDSHSRHQLFLAFKEALNNIVCHSGATEVRLSFAQENGQLRLTIADNGRGLPEAMDSGLQDGLANLRARLARLNGRAEIRSRPGQGVTVSLYVPLPHDHGGHC
ncbi:MAG: histidine kinase [Verrucomicrobiales bacterium]|nr:histidine kinase [Verrucomicrobiales bacterium]